MLSAAKHLAADRDRSFASLRMTRCDGSNGQVQFAQIEPCLNLLNWIAEHPPMADKSALGGINRPLQMAALFS